MPFVGLPFYKNNSSSSCVDSGYSVDSNYESFLNTLIVFFVQSHRVDSFGGRFSKKKRHFKQNLEF